MGDAHVDVSPRDSVGALNDVQPSLPQRRDFHYVPGCRAPTTAALPCPEWLWLAPFCIRRGAGFGIVGQLALSTRFGWHGSWGRLGNVHVCKCKQTTAVNKRGGASSVQIATGAGGGEGVIGGRPKGQGGQCGSFRHRDGKHRRAKPFPEQSLPPLSQPPSCCTRCIDRQAVTRVCAIPRSHCTPVLLHNGDCTHTDGRCTRWALALTCVATLGQPRGRHCCRLKAGCERDNLRWRAEVQRGPAGRPRGACGQHGSFRHRGRKDHQRCRPQTVLASPSPPDPVLCAVHAITVAAAAPGQATPRSQCPPLLLRDGVHTRIDA